MKLACETGLVRRLDPTMEATVPVASGGRSAHAVTFIGLLLFTILLYVRPNELYPQIFGTAPIVKTLAIVTVLVYIFATASRGEALTIWPIEVKMVLLLLMLGIVCVPLAASPQDSIDVLSETFVKVAIIFVLMVNVIHSKDRLLWILRATVICGAWIAACAVRDYQAGLFLGSEDEMRISGIVGGIFGNANDLATALNVLLPVSLALLMTAKKSWKLLYLACSIAIFVAVVITFSRTGFLGLLASGSVLIWKIGRKNRVTTILAAVLIVGSFVVLAPGGYSDRLSTIVNVQGDATGSAQERRDLMFRAASVALYHPVVGVGMGNFHIYSIRERVAHNAYLEIAAELGFVGLLAYLTLLVVPFASLRRIEREITADEDRKSAADRGNRDKYYLCVALQASLVAYAVCSFFASIEYQWLLYYIVAHAVALRRIHQEVPATARVDAPTGGRAPAALLRGALWKPYQRRRPGAAPEPDFFEPSI